MDTKLILLTNWQREFVDQFTVQPDAKSLLVAAPGMGKTVTALVAARKLLNENKIDSLLIISDQRVLREQWIRSAQQSGFDNIGTGYFDRNGLSTTLQSLRRIDSSIEFAEVARRSRWLIVADESDRNTKALNLLIDRILSFNKDSKALFIASTMPRNLAFDTEFRFNSEFIIDHRIILARSTEISIAKFSPSFPILRQLQRGSVAIDGMSWRDFEKFVAILLESDGYKVELMQGSKDGGVDVIAVKELGPNGYFKALWQAKKKSTKNKVGISVVRELADTRQEFGASKGIIVTSSYLTSGALERVNREKYVLGKVDRDDLEGWIQRVLYRKP